MEPDKIIRVSVHILTFSLMHEFDLAPAMPIQYRVIDLANPAIDPDERIVQSTSPERAVMEALGVEVVRSGSKRDLRARVYFQYPGQPLSMVRLYSKLEGRQA